MWVQIPQNAPGIKLGKSILQLLDGQQLLIAHQAIAYASGELSSGSVFRHQPEDPPKGVEGLRKVDSRNSMGAPLEADKGTPLYRYTKDGPEIMGYMYVD